MSSYRLQYVATYKRTPVMSDKNKQHFQALKNKQISDKLQLFMFILFLRVIKKWLKLCATD